MVSRAVKMTGNIFILVIFASLAVSWTISEVEVRKLRRLPSVTANALNYSFHPVTIPLVSAAHGSCEYEHSINLNETNVKALLGMYYTKGRNDLLIEAVFIAGVFPFRGKKILHYRISDPAVEEALLEYIRTHEDELFDPHFRKMIRDMVFHHKEFLKKIGGGSMYRGIHNAGIIPVIRAGKDPEEEWVKIQASPVMEHNSPEQPQQITY